MVSDGNDDVDGNYNDDDDDDEGIKCVWPYLTFTSSQFTFLCRFLTVGFVQYTN